MRKINKIIIGLLVVLFFIFVSASILIALAGKKIVVSQIEQNLKVKADLDALSFRFPFSVDLAGLQIGDLIKIDRIIATPSILGFFAGRVVFSGLTIVNPVINLEQEKDGHLNLPHLEQKGKQPPILLAGLSVRNGKFIFRDKKIAEDYKVILDRINADISKVKFPPTSLNTKFKISADFVKPDSKVMGNISVEGWLDFGSKDMDAILEMKNFDITYFAPYYGNFISDKKLLSARLDFASELKAKNNNLLIASKFKLSDLVYEEEQLQLKEEQLPKLDMVRNALDFFADKQGNISFDFTINTKLDNPKLSPEELRRVMLEAAMKNLSRQSPQSIIEKVTTNIEQFKEIGRQLKDIFRKKGE